MLAAILLASERSERDTLRSVQLRIADIYIIGEREKRARHSQVCSIENRGYILLASERSERDILMSVQLRIADIYIYIMYSTCKILFLEPVKKAERNFEIAAKTLCFTCMWSYAALYKAEVKIPLPRQHFSSRILLDTKLCESYCF